MADVGQQVGNIGKSLIPQFSANVILYVLAFIVIMGLIGWAFFIMFKRMKYNLSFVIFRDVGGRPKVIDRCKGMQITLGKTGEKVFFIKKYNKYLPLGNLEMGIRTYWYYIDKAGHWHNIDVGFIDVKKREPQLNMQLQMDYARDGINKRLEDRHNKEGFWAKWGMVLVSITVIAVLLVFMWLIFRDALANNNTAQANLQKSQEIQKELTEKYTNLLLALDSVCGHNVDVSRIINQNSTNT